MGKIKNQNKGTQPSHTLDFKHIKVWNHLFFTFHASPYERTPLIKSDLQVSLCAIYFWHTERDTVLILCCIWITNQYTKETIYWFPYPFAFDHNHDYNHRKELLAWVSEINTTKTNKVKKPQEDIKVTAPWKRKEGWPHGFLTHTMVRERGI